VTGPTKKYDIPISDNLLQTPLKLELNDVANVHNLAEAAIARAGFGEGSAVTDVILTEAPQFIHPEEPRWTVRVARQSQSAEIFADRAGALFPAPAPRAGAPRIVIHATANTWIRVRDADQSVLFDDVLHSGDSYSVPNAPGLSLRDRQRRWTGNHHRRQTHAADRRLHDPARRRTGTRRSPCRDGDSAIRLKAEEKRYIGRNWSINASPFEAA
jgi:hypothetical protein